MRHDDRPLREAGHCPWRIEAGHADGLRRLPAIPQDGVDSPQSFWGCRSRGAPTANPTADDPQRAVGPAEGGVSDARERRIER